MPDKSEDLLDAAIRDAMGGGEPAETEETEGAPPEAEAGEAAEAHEAAGAEEVDDLPEHWGADIREKWKALPPEHKELLLDARKHYEAKFNKKSQKLSDKQRYWKDIKQTFAPLKPLLDQSGTSKIQAIKQLVNAQIALQTQPDAAFEHLARNFAAGRGEQERQAILTRFSRALGVDPGAGQKPAQAGDDYLDPVAGQKIALLEKQLSQLSQGMTQQTAFAKAQAVAQAQQMIDTFKASHPHFDALEKSIEGILFSPLIPQHLPPTERLEKAYNYALRMDDELFQRVEAEKRQAKAKEDAEKRRKENEQSKRAARNPEGQSVSAVPMKKGGLDEIIKDVMSGASA